MTKLAELTEKIVRSVGGGKNTIDGDVDYPWVESNIPRWRQEAIFECYSGTRGKNGARASNTLLPPELFQTFDVEIDPKLQDTALNYIIAILPSPVRISSAMNGSNFVGNGETGIGFAKISSASRASDLLRRGDLNKDVVGYLDIAEETRIYGDKEIKIVSAVRICANPADAPNFDIDEDEYPNSDDVETLLLAKAQAEITGQTIKPADPIDDGSNTLNRRPIAGSNV